MIKQDLGSPEVAAAERTRLDLGTILDGLRDEWIEQGEQTVLPAVATPSEADKQWRLGDEVNLKDDRRALVKQRTPMLNCGAQNMAISAGFHNLIYNNKGTTPHVAHCNLALRSATYTADTLLETAKVRWMEGDPRGVISLIEPWLDTRVLHMGTNAMLCVAVGTSIYG